jgi:hypothetical protein
MALKAKKTEMQGDTSRWVTREEAKKGSKKVRRRVSKAEVQAQLKETPKVS